MNKDYVAGLVDGEGSLCIIRRHNDYTTTYSPHLSIVNTNKELLQIVSDWFGLGKVYLADKKQAEDGFKRRHCYTLNMFGATLVDALPMFMDSLVLKKEQAIVLLKAARLIDVAGKRYAPGVREELEKLYDYNQWLNSGEIYKL